MINGFLEEEEGQMIHCKG